LDQVRVRLSGCPRDVPDLDRIREVNSLSEKVKLSFGNGYEHFAFSGESQVIDGHKVAVFTWCGRTKIAE
jgi:hypothetical protein